MVLPASAASIPRDILRRDDGDLWQVPAQDTWTQISTVSTPIDDGLKEGRNISAYPALYNRGGTLFLSYSTGLTDIDAQGQDVRVVYQKGDDTWSDPQVAFESAVLPGQVPSDSKSYCDQDYWQRSLQSLGFVWLPSDNEPGGPFYVIAQAVGTKCGDTYTSAGRLARRIDYTSDNSFSSDPCWIEINNDAIVEQDWDHTIYGNYNNKGGFGLAVCEDSDAINKYLSQYQYVPPVSTELYINPVQSADKTHNMSFPTHGELLTTKNSNAARIERFWNDVSVSNISSHLWVEYTSSDGSAWYPNKDNTFGGPVLTNIPMADSTANAFFGRYDSGKPEDAFDFLVHNPAMDRATDLTLMLTIAISRGDGPEFQTVGIVRADADPNPPVGSRSGSKTPGFTWPSVAAVGNQLVIAYTENNFRTSISTINVSDLP
jgi:hypothetical protein